MASYQEWNDKIYDHFFNDTSIQDTIFMCVDSEVINYIGNILGVSGSKEENFCKCVLEQIIEKNSKGYYKLSIKIRNNNEKYNSTPFQTAIIAFYIYIASKMGENPIYRANAFWPLFDEVVEKYYKPYDKTKQNSYYDFLFSLFGDFKNRINSLHNIEFDFPDLFNRKYKRDFIGLPIFQSMISAKDRCILTQKFYEHKNKYSKINSNDIIKGNNYSKVFRKIRDEYKEDFIERIDAIAQSWDGNVYEYDNIRKTRNSSIIPLIYQYKIDSNGILKFFITTNNIKNFDINFEKYKLNSNTPRALLSENNITLQECSYQILNQRIKIARTKAEFILFKKDSETNLYTEVLGNNKVRVGDTFSIIASIEFFNDEYNKDSLEKIISNYDEQNSRCINDNLYILHGAVAENYNNRFVYLSKKDKITFYKGLRSGYKISNSYVKGAEPLIKVEDMKNVNIDGHIYYIEPQQEYGENVYRKVFDIRINHNNYGNHNIKLENSSYTKQYEIIPISNMAQQDSSSEYIYNIIDKKIKKSKYAGTNDKIVIGANFQNISECYECNNKKIMYILKILELHKNEKVYPMPKVLRDECIQLTHNNEDFNKYINNNLYIDNYIHKYLCKLKEV